MTNNDLSYAEIRQLRGERTRAAFAAELGVDPQTIYRWELEPSSPQSRRPRGKMLAKLRALGDHGSVVATAASPGSDPGDTAMLAALQHVLDGDYREPESAFVRALSDRDATATVRVIASTGLACIELLYRADSRRALAALGPAMSAGAPPYALAEAAAALAYSFPDGELFDVGRVHAHAVRAEQLGRDSPVARALAIAAEANAALMSADDDLLSRALSRADEIGPGWLPELAGMFVEQLRALAASRSGSLRLSNERIERLLANPRIAIAPPIEARVCAMRAVRMLDELGDPTEALALALRARRVSEQARLPRGVHTGVALRAEGEALFRLGRLDDAGRVFAEADLMLVENKFPATIVLAAQVRYLMVQGRADELDTQAARLAAIELPSVRGIAQAFAAWFSATASLVRGESSMLAAFTRAERLCERWAPLARDIAIATASVALSCGDADARGAFVRAQRAVDRAPTAWAAAQLRRIEGNLLVIEGRLEEGRITFEAAAATFAAAGDRIDAALANFGSASMQVALGEAGAKERLERVTAELDAMGAARPSWIARGVEHGARVLAQVERKQRGKTVPRSLEVALQRLAVTGATQAMIRRELVAIASSLAGATAALDDGSESDDATWFDVGSHARLRVDAKLPLDDDRRAALRVIALVGGIALDAAELRAGDSPTSAPRDLGEIPGMIAASPAMRRVMADIGRLASSRATVVITGESGVGKEVVARALHQRSERAAQPYVAFNCAAVPHELFEGQLFGYRKGAFTGATADQPGVIRAADGGTLFLDEIGELPLDIQPKLLRFLDNAEVFPLGAKRAVVVDVRVIAATNRDLADEVRKGRFREDLYYRLLVVPLVVPPLRERREDIMPLARYFARMLVAHGRAPAFAPDAVAAMTEHAWPGNVRELRNVIARALAFSPQPDVLTRAQLGL
jgi:Sigma-54 interaction domain